MSKLERSMYIRTTDQPLSSKTCLSLRFHAQPANNNLKMLPHLVEPVVAVGVNVSAAAALINIVVLHRLARAKQPHLEHKRLLWCQFVFVCGPFLAVKDLTC